jgi:hypothetical protein
MPADTIRALTSALRAAFPINPGDACCVEAEDSGTARFVPHANPHPLGLLIPPEGLCD